MHNELYKKVAQVGLLFSEDTVLVYHDINDVRKKPPIGGDQTAQPFPRAILIIFHPYEVYLDGSRSRGLSF
jgi:hypothetical protein